VDTLTNVEAIGGTYYIDRMYGGTGNYNQIFAGNKGGDVIDGGAGRDDRVWHGDDPSGVVVNLSAQTVNTQAVTQFANSIKYAGVDGSLSSILVMKEAFENLETPTVKSVASNRALDGWGSVDVLSNVEAAQGSAFNDQLYGSNDRNILSGGDGFDFIVGNGGNDYIVGGMGHDFLYGGLGRDWIVVDELNWGKLTPASGVNRAVRDLDQSGNLVVYKSVNESTTQNADVIDGFVLGDDFIDLTAIDANTKRSGNQDFNHTIVTAWTKKAGELKIAVWWTTTTTPLAMPALDTSSRAYSWKGM
jgi:Ca2+-binding RTX toxin-like protein